MEIVQAFALCWGCMASGLLGVGLLSAWRGWDQPAITNWKNKGFRP